MSKSGEAAMAALRSFPVSRLQAWLLGLLALLIGLVLTAWISHVEWGRQHTERERALNVAAMDVEIALRGE